MGIAEMIEAEAQANAICIAAAEFRCAFGGTFVKAKPYFGGIGV
jgi:hypothetical protein